MAIIVAAEWLTDLDCVCHMYSQETGDESQTYLKEITLNHLLETKILIHLIS